MRLAEVLRSSSVPSSSSNDNTSFRRRFNNERSKHERKIGNHERRSLERVTQTFERWTESERESGFFHHRDEEEE